MSASRIERLMNLVAYLSNTRRPLTLKEIVEAIPGYPESASASRRAFERDKEDLRAMSFDVSLEETPNGESGYLIKKENTYFDVNLNSSQRSIVEYALALYAPEEKVATSALTKLGGMNPENAVEQVMSLAMPEYVDDIYIAITNKTSLKIVFRGQVRHISPHKVVAKSGYWYVQSMDLDKNQSRTFRIDRIEKIEHCDLAFVEYSENETSNDEDDGFTEFLVSVNPVLLKQFALTWNGTADDQSSTVRFSVPRKEVFISRLYEYSGFVAIIEPPEIVEDIQDAFVQAKQLLGGD